MPRRSDSITVWFGDDKVKDNISPGAISTVDGVKIESELTAIVKTAAET